MSILLVALPILAQFTPPAIPGQFLDGKPTRLPIATLSRTQSTTRLSPFFLESRFTVSDDGKYVAIVREGLEVINISTGDVKRHEISAAVHEQKPPVLIVRQVAKEDQGHFSSPVRLLSLLRLRQNRITTLFTSDVRAQMEKRWTGVGSVDLESGATGTSVPWTMSLFPQRTFAATIDRGEVVAVKGKQDNQGNASDLALFGKKRMQSVAAGAIGSPLLLCDRQSGFAITPQDDERLALMDVSGKRARLVDFPGRNRAEFIIGNLAWVGKNVALVSVLKAYRARANASNDWIPQLYLFNAKARTWTYIGSHSLIGTSPNGYLLFAQRDNTKYAWLVKTKRT